MGFSLLVLLGLGYLIYQSSQQTQQRHEPMPPSKSSVDILSERYARGEINREQYHSMREDLEH